MENRTVEMPLSVFSDLQKVIKEITATQKIGGVVPRPILKKLKGLLLQIIEEQKKIIEGQKKIIEEQKKLKERHKKLEEGHKKLKGEQEVTALVVKQYMSDREKRRKKRQ